MTWSAWGGIYTEHHCSPNEDEARQYADDIAPEGAFERVEDNTPVLTRVDAVRSAMQAEGVGSALAERVVRRLTTDRK